MSDSTQIISTTPSADVLKAIQGLERQLASLKASLNIPVDVAPRGTKSTSKKAAKPATAAPPRVLADSIKQMNEDRLKIFAELRSGWLSRFPQFTDLAQAAWADDASAKAKKALSDAVKAAGTEVPPRYSDALTLHGARLRAADPTGEVAKKQDARRKKLEADQAERRSQKSGGSDTASVVPPAPVATAPPAKKTGGGRKKKDAVAKTEPSPAPAPAPAPAVTTSVVVVSDDNEEAFRDWEHKGTAYFKNGLNFVYKKTSKGGFGDYAGQYDPVKRLIDATVPEPEPED